MNRYSILGTAAGSAGGWRGGKREQSGDGSGARLEYPGGGRRAARRDDEFRDQPEAGDSEKLGKLHFADAGAARLPAAGRRVREVPAGAQDIESWRRRTGESGFGGNRAAVFAPAGGKAAIDGAPRRAGSRRSGVHRKSGGAGIFQSEYVGGPPDVRTFDERGKGAGGVAAEARDRSDRAAKWIEEENAENDYDDFTFVGGTGSGEGTRVRSG